MAHLAHYKRSGAAPMLAHYERRPELERGFTRENIDASRTAENYAIGADSPQALAAALRARVDGAIAAHEADSGKAIRRDANVLSDWVVTLPRDCPRQDARRFFETAVDVCRARYGAENVLGGFVHMDETTPHVHIPVVPVRDGRIRAAKVFTRSDLQRFHKDLGRAEDAALGRHVSVELDQERQGEKQLSHLGQAEYVAAREEARRASERASAAEGARRAAESAQRAAEDARDAEMARLEAQREYGARLARALGDAEGRRADLDRQVARLAQERDGMQAQADEAKASRVTEASKLQGLRDEVAKKQVVAADLSAEIEKKTAEKAEILAEIADLSEKQAAAQDRLECLQAAERDAESLAAAGLGEVRRVAREGGWAGGREQAAQAENQELRGRLASLEGESRELGERVATLEEEAQGAGDGLGALEGERRELGGRVRGLGARKERLGREVEQLEERVQGLERRAGQLRGLLDRARARLDGLAERLAGVLTSAPDLARRLRPDSVELLRSWGMLPQPQRRRGFGRAR